jgi:hypothetical protein
LRGTRTTEVLLRAAHGYSDRDLKDKQYVRAIDESGLFGFNQNMIRCLSCDGILTKQEEVCYRCGDPAPEHVKSAQNCVPLLLVLGLVVSVGFTAYSFWFGATR